ncbi:hypothetical protein THAOC_28338, partial [Thalassiosira oceanica]
MIQGGLILFDKNGDAKYAYEEEIGSPINIDDVVAALKDLMLHASKCPTSTIIRQQYSYAKRDADIVDCSYAKRAAANAAPASPTDLCPAPLSPSSGSATG